MDSVERAIFEKGLPQTVGLPTLESMLILSIVDRVPGKLKSELVGMALDSLGLDRHNAERQFLKYVDWLRDLGFISISSFRVYITPAGTDYLELRRQELEVALLTVL
jgi:DNA-directed RNA polymerase subunit N (RpoN/RPB10)